MPQTGITVEPDGVKESKQLPKGKESLLVVEDEGSVRALAVRILRECGYQVQEAGDALSALEIIHRNQPFDLVITDVIMPHMSGKQLQEQIKIQRPQTKALMMSGYTDDALAPHGAMEEGLCFLEKPFSPSQLSKKVREVLDAP